MEHIAKRSASETSIEDDSRSSHTKAKRSRQSSESTPDPQVADEVAIAIAAGASTDTAAQERFRVDLDNLVNEMLLSRNFSEGSAETILAVVATIMKAVYHREAYGDVDRVVRDPECNTLIRRALEEARGYNSVLLPMASL